MKITAQELHALGVVEEVIPEPPGGAHRDPALAARYVGEALKRHLEELLALSLEELFQRRMERFRKTGNEYLNEQNTN
jgi:acetyl-CoA carboxylase carboxyl transferase subunit alpha